MKIKVIGAGLAGCEAAWQAANLGAEVELYEMKPIKKSAAHKSDDFAELVCSNSLRADGLQNAVGLIKEEMRGFNSIIMKCADENRVPAGGALAVDRNEFSRAVTDAIKSHSKITIINEEVSEINTDEYTIVAGGPLASDSLTDEIKRITGDDHLHFFDAAAPIVAYESIDMTKAFKAARYGKGGADYINCPMTKDEYLNFWKELITAETAKLHDGIENPNVFEGCMPIEIMAKRGEDTMRFGPLKPVGLTNPNDNSRPYAVVQLRQDDAKHSMFNIVGFQTHLKQGEQRRVFGLIPGLENAEFVRYGVMHRNTYLNSPKLLTNTYRTRKYPKLYFAGQITGVEGYIESASSGLVAGICAARSALGMKEMILDSKTAIGALSNYVSNESITNFQPMNVNFGIFEDLGIRIKDKKEKATRYCDRSLSSLKTLWKTL